MGVVPIPARVRSTALLLQTLESRSQENQRPDEVSRAHALLPRLWYRQASPTNGSIAVAALGGVRVLTFEKLLPTSHTDVLPW
eukprot:4603940-Pleurochrysis_carterae.AAC.1